MTTGAWSWLRQPQKQPSEQLVTEPPRLLIERVAPSLDGGRYPIKRTVGDTIQVSADIIKDGHDLIGANVVYRPPGGSAVYRAPLRYEYNPDRWFGSFDVHQVGTYTFTIEAWPDPIKTWRSELPKRLGAGDPPKPELLEGRALIERRAARETGEKKQRLLALAQRIGAPNGSITDSVALALSEEWLPLVAGPMALEEVTRFAPELRLIVDREIATFAAWYELFPRSESPDPGRHGTFADVERRLPELASLGFDVLYFPPIHPIGNTHRKGKNNTSNPVPEDVGSPWAIGAEIGGHTAIHPDLGSFDDFDRLVRSASEFGMEVALDFALQCSPDHPWTKEHPDWFFIRTDGSIRYAENPPKKYQDIYPINFWCDDREALWNACRDIVLFWIEHGVRTFRVDNPHTKPLSFWEWLIADVTAVHPDVVFLSESFTRPKRMQALSKLGFTQSYTYFTWKNTKQELIEYLTELTSSEMTEYYRPNLFCNTPDILHEYLQTGGRPAFKVRLLLAGTLAPVYGIYSGFELCENVPVRPGSEEYLDSEKYEIKHRNYNSPLNLKKEIARLNRIRRENPALQKLDNLQFLNTLNDQILAYSKTTHDNQLIIVANLDPASVQETLLEVPLDQLGIAEGARFVVADLLTGERYTWQGRMNYVRLDPSERPGHLLRIESKVSA